MDQSIANILDQFPFLSYGRLVDTEYLGIIQNTDNRMLSMYVLDCIPTEDLRRQFLKCGEDWWWGSNRELPINIFLKDRFRVFRPFLKHFSRKDFELIAGPAVSLQDTIARRVRRRKITLVRKMD